MMGVRFIVIAALLAAAAALLVPWLVRAVLFPAPRGPSEPRIAGIPELEILHLGSEGAEAWWMPAFDAAGAARPALIFFHGNGELIDDWAFEFQVPRSWGLGILLVEYPGYGRSPGTASEASVTSVALAAWDTLAGRGDVDASQIVAYGRSLGGGAACALARERAVMALVLESTFTSVRDMVPRFLVPSFLLRDRFESEAVVARFEGPMLIVHGERDEVVPVAHAHRLHEAAHSSERAELVIVPCGHNDCPRPWSTLQRFLARDGIVTP